GFPPARTVPVAVMDNGSRLSAIPDRLLSRGLLGCKALADPARSRNRLCSLNADETHGTRYALLLLSGRPWGASASVRLSRVAGSSSSYRRVVDSFATGDDRPEIVASATPPADEYYLPERDR